MDLFHAFTGKPHPNRPEAETRTERYQKLRARLEAQKARLSATPDPEPEEPTDP